MRRGAGDGDDEAPAPGGKDALTTPVLRLY
jgi:hypothetical protein